jgi:hypothetical protein
MARVYISLLVACLQPEDVSLRKGGSMPEGLRHLSWLGLYDEPARMKPQEVPYQRHLRVKPRGFS